jgi:hypothetical protein
MNNLNAFYKIGTIGLLLTAVLHIVLSLTLSTSVHTSFAVVYPSWIAFLVLGTTQLSRKKTEE